MELLGGIAPIFAHPNFLLNCVLALHGGVHMKLATNQEVQSNSEAYRL